jgi:hypothetical protein
MDVNALADLRILILILCLALIPGWFLLAITGIWRQWQPLVRWIVAVGIGIAFYPVLFYLSRLILPEFQIGFNKLVLLLVAMMAITIWRLRKCWKEQFAFSTSEWVALGVFGATLFTRLWLAHLRPYPAWSDSLHHTLLTQLTALNGRLPYTLDPYESVPLSMYHLGLYALSGSLQILSQVPAYTALLWTVQFLNGLCGVGVYLVLDRSVGRKAALVGTAVAGLLSFQPSWYVNWGRDTQVASQAILLIGWWVTWEAIQNWAKPERPPKVELFGWTIAAALLSAGVFLLHFRVAGFYLPLLAFSALWELYKSIRRKNPRRAIAGIAIIGAFSILLALPALINALNVYIQGRSQVSNVEAFASSTYYQFPLDAIFSIGMQPWLFWLAAACAIFLLLRRSKFGFLILIWIGLLWLEGNAYLFKIPMLAFTNYGAVIIMYYLPLSLIIGAGFEEFFLFIPWLNRSLWAQQASLVILLLVGFAGGVQRITEIEPYRYFLTNEDLTAMNWINQNTPADALFAINTYNWLGSNPHGTDGGFWIPYFTGRKTTTGTMMNGLGSQEYRNQITDYAKLVDQLGKQSVLASDLCNKGINYVYLGEKRGNFTGAGILAENIVNGVKVYDQQGVQIYKVCP